MSCLFRYCDVPHQSNARYLNTLAPVENSTPGLPGVDGLYAPIGLRRPPGAGPAPIALLASGNGGGGMAWIREAVHNRGWIMERLLQAGYAVAWLSYRAEVELGYHKGGRILELTGGAGVDRVVDVDFGANLAVSVKVHKVNGTIATYASMGDPEPKLSFYPLMAKNVTIRPVLIYTMPDRARDEAVTDILRLVEAGRLLHQIEARYPLDRIVEAHQAQESGKVTGNIVVDVGPVP